MDTRRRNLMIAAGVGLGAFLLWPRKSDAQDLWDDWGDDVPDDVPPVVVTPEVRPPDPVAPRPTGSEAVRRQQSALNQLRATVSAGRSGAASMVAHKSEENAAKAVVADRWSMYWRLHGCSRQGALVEDGLMGPCTRSAMRQAEEAFELWRSISVARGDGYPLSPIATFTATAPMVEQWRDLLATSSRQRANAALAFGMMARRWGV